MSDKNRINPPSTIQIGPRVCKILYPYQFLERGELWGQYDSTVGEIRIVGVDGGGQRLSDMTIAVTLLHEIFHAIDKSVGPLFKSDETEAVIDTLTHSLLALHLNNPEFTDYIRAICEMEREKKLNVPEVKDEEDIL